MELHPFCRTTYSEETIGELEEHVRECAMCEEMNRYVEGDRVITEAHGAGTVLGPDLYTCPQSGKTMWLQRWRVKLDEAHKHPWYAKGIACYWERNLKKEKSDA